MKERFDKVYVGLIAGIVGIFAGFFLLAIVWSIANKMSVKYFIDEIFIASPLFKDKIITVSVLFNVLLFFVSNKLGYFRISKGILAIVLLAVPIIIYFN